MPSRRAFKTYLAKYTYARLAALYIRALEQPGAARKETGGAAPGALNEPPLRVGSAGATRWQPYFIKARDAKTYVPFLVSLDRAAATRQKLAMYYRVARADAPPDAGGGPAKPEYEDYRELEVTGGGTDGPFVQAAFAVAGGDYVVSIALTPLDVSKPRKDTIAELMRRVDRGDPDLVRQRLAIPNFWDGKLATSSILLARETKPAAGQALTAAEQAAHPFRMGATEIVPAKTARFSRSEELQAMVFVYNPSRRPETNKPDVKVDYAFYAQAAGSERYFNRTATLTLNARTLPAAFDLDAGDQITAGQAVALATFAPGDYRLQITVTDTVRNETVTASVTFTV